jgi:hypothetical protein
MLRRQDNLIGQILQRILMKQRALKIVENCLNTSIYSYLETTGGQSYNLF